MSCWLSAKYRCRLGASSGKLVTDECAQLEHNTSASIYKRALVYNDHNINRKTKSTTQAQARVRKSPLARRHCQPESFCASGKFLRVYTKLTLKSSQLSGKFPDSLESFWTVWKVSGQSGKFPDSLESFWTVEKVSRQSGTSSGTFFVTRQSVSTGKLRLFRALGLGWSKMFKML